MKSKMDEAIKNMSFEDALTELETIVVQLERGEASLQESINIYKRGAVLKAHCEQKLKTAQMQVDKIVLDTQGNTSSEPFDK